MLFPLIERSLTGVRSAADKQRRKLDEANAALLNKDEQLEVTLHAEVRRLEEQIERLHDKRFVEGAEIDDKIKANTSRIQRCDKIVKALDSVTNEEVSV